MPCTCSPVVVLPSTFPVAADAVPHPGYACTPFLNHVSQQRTLCTPQSTFVPSFIPSQPPFDCERCTCIAFADGAAAAHNLHAARAMLGTLCNPLPPLPPSHCLFPGPPPLFDAAADTLEHTTGPLLPIVLIPKSSTRHSLAPACHQVVQCAITCACSPTAVASMFFALTLVHILATPFR